MDNVIKKPGSYIWDQFSNECNLKLRKYKVEKEETWGQSEKRLNVVGNNEFMSHELNIA